MQRPREGQEAPLTSTSLAPPFAAAAFSPNGELQHAGLGESFMATWQLWQLPLVQQQEFSSTVREVLEPRLLLEALAQAAPQLLTSQSVQYRSDSQTAVSIINGQSGNEWAHPEVRRLWELCKHLDLELQAVWFPRTQLEQQRADALSKEPDSTQWLLSSAAFSMLQLAAGSLQCGGWPQLSPAAGKSRFTIDLFADDYSTKVQKRFFSRYFCPCTSGVDAFSHRWDCYWDPGSCRWRRHFGFCNGPFDCLGRILRKIKDGRADVALVYTVWPRPWRQLLWQLRQLGVVRQDVRLDTAQLRSDLFQAGPRVPGVRPGSSHEPRYAVHCVFIVWEKLQYRSLPAMHP